MLSLVPKLLCFVVLARKVALHVLEVLIPLDVAVSRCRRLVVGRWHVLANQWLVVEPTDEVLERLASVLFLLGREDQLLVLVGRVAFVTLGDEVLIVEGQFLLELRLAEVRFGVFD